MLLQLRMLMCEMFLLVKAKKYTGTNKTTGKCQSRQFFDVPVTGSEVGIKSQSIVQSSSKSQSHQVTPQVPGDVGAMYTCPEPPLQTCQNLPVVV